jgi:tRNA(fMet)-specific endonuclease VapC
MKYMLDTNIIIYLIKNKPPTVADRINSMSTDDTLCMSFVTYAELLKGAERCTRKAETMRQIGLLARQIPVAHGTNNALCQHYAHHATRLRTAGTPIGCNDLWIACHALSEGMTLVTNNMDEFRRIEGLNLENWAST